jgi:hypothetical protein
VYPSNLQQKVSTHHKADLQIPPLVRLTVDKVKPNYTYGTNLPKNNSKYFTAPAEGQRKKLFYDLL